MPFSWVADPHAEAEGVVLAVDVTQHARSAGFGSATLLSRGLWARFIGDGPGQEQRLGATLSAANRQMTSPSKASEDGTALLFALTTDAVSETVVALVDAARGNVTFMTWREFSHRPADGSLRVRIVAEESDRSMQ